MQQVMPLAAYQAFQKNFRFYDDENWFAPTPLKGLGSRLSNGNCLPRWKAEKFLKKTFHFMMTKTGFLYLYIVG